jgi:hypothetical protein
MSISPEITPVLLIIQEVNNMSSMHGQCLKDGLTLIIRYCILLAAPNFLSLLEDSGYASYYIDTEDAQ